METRRPRPSSWPSRTWTRASSVAVTAACLVALAAWPAFAQVGAEATGGWNQVQGGAEHAGALASAPAPPYAQAWSHAVAPGGPSGQLGLSAPVVSGDTVVTVGPDQVLGLDPATGEQRWSVDRDLGPSVPPAIADIGGRMAVVFTEGFGEHPPGSSPTPVASAPTPTPAVGEGEAAPFDSHLSAVDAQTRKPLWQPVQLDRVSRTGVTVSGTTAYVGDNAGTVYAIDLADGTLVWRIGVNGFVTTPLAVAGDRVIAAVQGDRTAAPAIVALNTSDGSQAWRYEGDRGAFLVTAPAVSDATVYAGFSDATVRAVGLDDGALSWSSRLNAPINFTGGVAVADGAVFAADVFGQVYRLDAAGGSRTWDFALNEAVLRSPPVVGRATVLIATVQGRLNAIDAVSGHLVWRGEASGGQLRTLALTPNLVLGVRGGAEAGIVAFANDPEGALVDEVSPTVLAPGSLATGFALAVVPVAVALIALGRFLSARMGPAFIVEDGEDLDTTGDPEAEGT